MSDIRAEADRTGYDPVGYGTERYGGRGDGWVGFAALMLGLAGMWNVLQGIFAIAESRVYVADSTFVFSDLNTWGWIITVLGAVQLIAAFTVLSGSEWGRWLGIGAAFLNGIGQLMFLPAYPLWAVMMFKLWAARFHGQGR